MSKATITAGWDDVPHLSAAEKARLMEAIPPAFRDARMKGIPTIGEGAIYPIEPDGYLVDDMEIPAHWPRAYGFDVGWKATAAVHGALDRDYDILYLVSEYKRGMAEPPSHAAAIKPKSVGQTGASDPAARGRNQKDGSRLFDEYRELGLDLMLAKNAVEAGLLDCYVRLTTGRLKIFRSLKKTQAELRLYRRNEKGKIVKENDHLMDCMRYLVATLDDLVQAWQPPGVPKATRNRGEGGWMGQ